MTKQTMQMIVRQVRENQDRLSSCRNHDFSDDLTPEQPLGKQWRCIHCKGTVDSSAKMFYEQGVQHGEEYTRKKYENDYTYYRLNE